MNTLQLDDSSLQALRLGLQRAPALAVRELTVAMHRAVGAVHEQVVQTFPRGQVGDTYLSFQTDVMADADGVAGVVGSAAPVAAFVELGTKAHWVPYEPLKMWAMGKLGLGEREAMGMAVAVSRTIARRGTRAQEPLRKALEARTNEVLGHFEGAAEAVALHLAGLDGSRGLA